MTMVGWKACNCKDYICRTVDKISKGRRALNSASALGLKRGGLTMYASNVIYWCMIIHIVTYGSELWILKQNDIDALDKFQRYAGKRIQRFPVSCPNETSFAGLSWMRLENFIYAKKFIFIRTILVREESCIYRKILCLRARDFNNNIREGVENLNDSPIFDWLRISILFGLYETVMNMIFNAHFYPKNTWKEIVWKRAWGWRMPIGHLL